MALINPANNNFFYIKKGDLDPPLKIKIYDSQTDEVFNLTGYTAVFSMALKTDRNNPIIDESTADITDYSEGEAEYKWVSGDTDELGAYLFEFKFTKANKSFTIPVLNTGYVVIEPRIGT